MALAVSARAMCVMLIVLLGGSSGIVRSVHPRGRGAGAVERTG